MDQLTKLAHFLVEPMTFTLEEFCRLYIREIVRSHGVLVSIVSDRDPSFTTLIGMNHACISVEFSVFFIAKMHDS